MRKYPRAIHVMAFVVPALCLTVPLFAHSRPDRPTYEAGSGVPQRASRQADELVSMPADKILEILRESPGLMLAFKRTLVLKAYEQGRLLDSESLTDEAVYDLVRADVKIRVLATQEIEKRSYVRAKPTDEEI